MYFENYFLCKAEAPDGVEALVGKVVHEVDVAVDEVEDKAEAPVDEVDHDVHGYDLPMSIYSPLYITFCK